MTTRPDKKEKKASRAQGNRVTWLMSSMEAEASGPSSMLHPLQGFQFWVGGDQDTTPASGALEDVGKRWSRSASVIKEMGSDPSTP